MHPFFDYSVPHPYKMGQRMRPRNAVRLKLPDGVPGSYFWVSPAFFAYAQATPDWYARAVAQSQAILKAPLSQGSSAVGQAGLSGLATPASKGGSHD
jgi:hypothetical protein